MAESYTIEDARLSVFQEIMGNILGYPMKKFAINNCTAITCNVQSRQHALLILEAKNNLGASGDAYFRLLVHMGSTWIL